MNIKHTNSSLRAKPALLNASCVGQDGPDANKVSNRRVGGEGKAL